MSLLAVIENFDVLLDRCFRVSPCGVALMMNHVVLQATPEALHGRVVVAVPFARHGSLHAELRYQFPVVVSAVLRPTVRVVDQARSRTLTTHSAPQGLCRQR
jgi:hypothetical protein